MPDAASATPIYDKVKLPEWGFEGPVTYFEGTIYFSLRILCEYLGVEAQDQIERLRGHSTLKRFVRQAPIKTRTGVRETWAIERRGIGWWIATMRSDAVRASIRDRVIEFQEALIEEADRRFWSESERNPLAELRAAFTTLEREHVALKDRNTYLERYAISLEERIARLEEREARP